MPCKHMKMRHEYLRRLETEDCVWKHMEYLDVFGKWMRLSNEPNWEQTTKYRWKPCRLSVTLMSGEKVSWTEPMREAPEKIGTEFFWVALDGRVYEDSWCGGITDCSRLESNICHLTESAALEHLEAMRKINGQGG